MNCRLNEFQESVIDEMMAWICQNIERNITLDAISEYTGYSKWHMQRLFSEKYNEHILEHIRKRKILNAALDIFISSEKVMDLAFKYNYNSSSSFIRAFRDYFKCTPLCFKKHNTMKIFINKICEDLRPMNEVEHIKVTKVKQKIRTHQMLRNTYM